MVNKVILVGNVGGEPEIRFTQDGAKVSSFSIATSETWKSKDTGERQTRTQWHRIVVFNEQLATIVESYVKKGTRLYVEGALQTRKYTGNDGVERNITEVVLTRFKGEISILTPKGGETGFESSSFEPTSKKIEKPSTEESAEIGNDLDDEIPF